jgi:hypothetical protein
MARKKIRAASHIMESDSFKLVESLLPDDWLLRPFNNPDYGVDFVIELFEKRPEGYSEVLGEYLYVQLKSVEKVESKIEKVYPVGNVAKAKWSEDKSSFTEIEVVKFVIDTNSIFTIQQSGAGISVLLFLADLEARDVYFICVNDYIDKIILPKNPTYVSNENITLTIPKQNCLSNATVSLTALNFYGKRAKLLAAFSKIHFQKNEISYLFGFKDYPVMTYRDELEKNIARDELEVRNTLLYFIEQLEHLDFWEYRAISVIGEAKRKLDQLKIDLQNSSIRLTDLQGTVVITWHQLGNIGTMYEDIYREWFLPKHISRMLSYPE